MYCKHCGKQIDDNSNFCTFCGKHLVDTKKITIEIIKPQLNSKVKGSKLPNFICKYRLCKCIVKLRSFYNIVYGLISIALIFTGIFFFGTIMTKGELLSDFIKFLILDAAIIVVYGIVLMILYLYFYFSSFLK